MRARLRDPGLWIGIVAALIFGAQVAPEWKPTWDSAIYISLADSLAHGEGYAYLGRLYTKQPPGFPMLLAPLVFLFGESFLAMRILVATCGVVSIVVTYHLIRQLSTPAAAIAVSVMTASCYAVTFESTRVLGGLSGDAARFTQ